MLIYVIRRVLTVGFTFLTISLIIFLMMHSVPGGPFDGNEMPVSEAVRAKLMAQLNLDKPLHVQYLSYMWGVFQLDFGVPFQSPGESVISLISRAWVPSLILGGSGVLIGAPLGILLGLISALKRNSLIDYLVSAIATLGLTIPVFVTSMLLMLVFSVWLGWLPASGWPSPDRWILPIAAYATIPLATYARYSRAAVLDIIDRPFVTVLRAKGLSERQIVLQHVMRNAALPLVTIFAPMFIGIATGSIFVEAMFRIPGLGAFFVSSIERRDYPLEMALMLIVTFMYCVAFLLTDLLHAWLDPRIRHGGAK